MNDKPTSSPRVELTIEQSVATIALNRPEVRNAIDDQMRTEFMAALQRVTDDDAVRAVVLTGKGKAFCAGGDISGMQQRLRAPSGRIAYNGWRRQKRTHQLVSLLHGLPKPTIAAVNGAASGLGCDLALCCDFIIASTAASFAMSFLQRGLVPDGGSLYCLPRRVGLPRAKELIFSARTVPAEEALAIGLADRLSPADNLLKDAHDWAVQLSQGSSVAMALSKSVLDRAFELTEDQILDLGREAQAICYTTSEHHEAVAAFLNKKKSH
jgi:enoyl-CoA hydratase/carnithine racemase